MVMATQRGHDQEDRRSTRSRNIRVDAASSRCRIDEGDDLVGVRITDGDARPAARHARRLGDPLPRGERARRWAARRAACAASSCATSDDVVVGMAVVPREQPATLLTVCERGYGKRTPTSRLPDQEPRRQGRHHHQDHRAQRQGGRPAHRHRRRRPDADHRRRQADPHAGRRHPDHRPQHPGRAPHPPRGGREGGGHGAPGREGRGRDARSRPRWRPRAPRQQTAGRGGSRRGGATATTRTTTATRTTRATTTATGAGRRLDDRRRPMP